MSTDEVINFAQRRFGPDSELPVDADAVPTLPDWLEGHLGEAASLEEDDYLAVEGKIPKKKPPPAAADGTTPDTLAFYLPFHFYKSIWGIYVKASGVWSLAKRIGAGLVDINTVLAAHLVLVEHERQHFAAEYAASRIEIVSAESSYREYFRQPTAKEHEEGLANASAVTKLRRHAAPRTAKAVIEWMNRQPPGYRDFAQCMPPHFVAAERKAASFMSIVAFVANNFLGAESHPAEFLFRLSPQRIVPISWIFDVPIPWIRQIKPFPKDFGMQILVHSNDHKPPHIHIQAPPGRDTTRYRWPERTPLRGDPELGRRQRKNFERYIAVYGTAIDQRVKAVPWQ